jgi:hypothetical protein
MSTRPARQILPSGKGPPPETRGGTQNRATTARTKAGTNKNVNKMYCEPPCENSVPRRSGAARVDPRNQHRMALPRPATAPSMRKIGEVIAVASSVTARCVLLARGVVSAIDDSVSASNAAELVQKLLQLSLASTV